MPDNRELAQSLLDHLVLAEKHLVDLYQAFSPTANKESGNGFADKDPVIIKVREMISQARSALSES